MNALSRRAVAYLVLALLPVLMLSGPAALAQTPQLDAERMRRDGVERNDAAARAHGMEMERQRLQRERQAEEERRRSESIPSSQGGPAPAPSRDYSADGRRAAEARARYEKLPPLPANRNPLLGRWQLQRAGGGAQNSVLGMLANLGSMVCPGFAEGVLDFRETVLADGAGSALDHVRYRGVGNRVAVLGTRGVPLMEFDFEGPNRMRSTVSIDCQFTRVGSAGAATARAGTPDHAPPAQPGPQRRFEEDSGFRCAGGVLVLVKFCAPGGAHADCSVCQLGAAPNRSADACGPVTRAELTQRVNACEAGRIHFAADGGTTFEPTARR